MAAPGFPQMQNSPARPPPNKGNSGTFAVPLVLLLVFGAYVGSLLFAPMFIDGFGETIDGVVDVKIRLAIGGVLFIFFALILVYRLTDSGNPPPRPRAPPQQSPAPPMRPPAPRGQVNKFKPIPTQQSPTTRTDIKPSPGQKKVDSPSKPLEQGGVKSTIIPYPQEVEGGIYGDTLVDISDKKTLRIRSILVESDYMVQS